MYSYYSSFIVAILLDMTSQMLYCTLHIFPELASHASEFAYTCILQSGWAFGHYVLGFVQGLPKTARNCPKLPETARNCPKLPETARNCPKLPKTVQNYFYENILLK